MEDLTCFNHNLELGESTKKLMLGMISSMYSLVPSNPALVPGNISFRHSTIRKYAEEVLEIAEDNPDILDGIFDPDMLKKYISCSADFREIGDQLEKLLAAIRDYQNLSGFLSFKLASLIREHLEITNPEICGSLDTELPGVSGETNVKTPFKQVKNNLKIV